MKSVQELEVRNMSEKDYGTKKIRKKHDSFSGSVTSVPREHINALLSLASLCGIWLYFTVGDRQTGSILALPAFFAYHRVYQSILPMISRSSISRKKTFFLLTGGLTFLFSLCMTWGGMLDINGCFSSAWVCVAMVFCLFFALYPCVWFVTRKLDDFAENLLARPATPTAPQSLRKAKWICFAVVVAVWLVIYLGMYPGLYGYDAPYFLRQHMVETISVRIYPAYTTVFYKLFCLGLELGGSNESGLALAMAVQGVLSLFGIWQVLRFLEAYIQSKKAIVGAALFYTLLPTHAILSFSATTDAPFVIFFSMCVVHAIRIVLDQETYWKEPKNWLSFGMWMILLCLTRSNGMYVLLVFAVFIPLYLPRTRIKTLAVFLAAILIFQNCSGAINNYYGVADSGGSAFLSMLSIPVQQIGRTHENAYDRLSEEEWEVIYRYIPSDIFNVYNYQPCISDVLGRATNRELLTQDPETFAKMYITVLTRAPVECLQAGLLSCIGLWYPDKYYSDWRMYHPFIEYQMWTDAPNYDPIYPAIHRQSKLPLVDQGLAKLYGESRVEGVPVAFDDIPIFSTFTRIGLYFFALVYAFCYLLYRRRFCFLPCVALALGIVICVILGPVTFYRYSAPMIFSAPVWLTTLFIAPPERVHYVHGEP